MFRIISIEKEKYIEPYVCGLYHIISILSFFASSFRLSFCILKFRKSTEHSTSKILVIYFIFTSFIRAILAIYITSSIIYFGIKFNQLTFFQKIVILLIIKQRFIPFLMMADWNFRITKISGNGKKSVLFFGISVIFECIIIVIIYGVTFIPKLNVPLYFNINIFITVTCSAIMSKLLFEKAKKLRKQSVLSSSLIERHTFSKMVVFFKRFFPIILIDTFCAIICVSISLSVLYIININTFISFCLSFMWIEISTIINSFYIIKDKFIFNLREFWIKITTQKRSTKISPKEIHIATITGGKVPIGQTIDEYFNAFNFWIK